VGQFGIKRSAWNFGVQTGGRACHLPGSRASYRGFPHRLLVSEILCPGALSAGGEMF